VLGEVVWIGVLVSVGKLVVDGEIVSVIGWFEEVVGGTVIKVFPGTVGVKLR
jgi:hypothetical protein